MTGLVLGAENHKKVQLTVLGVGNRMGVSVNPHVQRVQNMYGKGGYGVKNAWLWVTFDQSLF